MAMIDKRKKRRYNDPIFDNHYNKGDLDFQIFDSKVEVDKKFMSINRQSYNAYEHFRDTELFEMLDSIYKDSVWSVNYPINCKIPKCDMPFIYSFFRDNIKDATYTETDIFITIAEYLDVSYKSLYDSIGSNYKRLLLEELDDKYHIIQNMRIAKLF